MTKFKREINKKCRNYQILIGLLLLMLLLVRFYNINGVAKGESFMSDLLMGVTSGLILVIVVYVYLLKKGIRNDDNLKKLYIHMSDERTNLIKTKSGIPLNLFNAYMVFLAAYVMEGVSHYISYSLIAVSMFLVVEALLLKFYYMKRL